MKLGNSLKNGWKYNENYKYYDEDNDKYDYAYNANDKYI